MGAEYEVSTAFEMGYRHVDTALVYENHVGVGKALAASGLPREDYFVTTKIPGGLDASATEQQLDECLDELKLDYVDLMLIHYPSDWDGNGGPAARKEEWLALEKWAKSGKARAIGVSHYCKSHVEDLLAVNTLPVAINQVEFHIGMGSESQTEQHDRAWMVEHGIVFESFSTLCGPCQPPGNMELITGDLVTSIGKNHGKSGAQVALRWAVQQNIPVIPKSSNPKHLKENFEIFDFELSDDEMSRLAAATSPAQDPGDVADCSIGLTDPLSEQFV